ncbi:hypothetical protein SRB5_27510 [Streptomyces sp. RB5]|uniref:Tail sheath protein subtilisin-like domain-containing protein n=1 Tax=Streptomyces smaragdinus TaxID=2585196 RepID=A0A7K0CGL4_9ACTN|nr:phage tail sheath subtilisin-like domain-containing protein [Streptomyces smaragdinus]MQY12615.1 hypothetical protein [Streptomyces smaragdinus]
MTGGLRLGAPGVYRVPADQGDTGLRPVALDAAGFAGVAPRGPVDVPVAVRGWPEFLARFGLGPGLLAPAVAAFFAQGGRLAHVLRVAPPPSEQAHALVGQGTYTDGRWVPLCVTGDGGRALPVRWTARDEGAWGDGLTVTLTAVRGRRFTVEPTGTDRTVLPPAGLRAPAGSLLQPAAGGVRWIEETAEREVRPGLRRTVWVLDAPLPDPDRPLALILATVTVNDPAGPTPETFDVGLAPRHPRWLADVLAAESLLVVPESDWAREAAGGDLRIALPDPLLPRIGSRLERPGTDRYADVAEEDLLGRPATEPPDTDPAGERPHRGAEELARVEDLGLLLVPDLAWNGVVPARETEEPPDPPPDGFVPCAARRPPARLRTPGVDAACLDARLPDELAVLQARQRWLTELADAAQRFVVLLDAPRRLPADAVADWCSGFDSGYAAAYHPWLGALPPEPDGPAPTARLTPPSAFAAGIIAARELAAGLPTGPANELAAGAVTAADQVTDAEHALLHPQGINVFRAERDGFRLTAARTLSRDPDYRRLTVRRLVTMLRLTLDRESQWAVFEPHTAALRQVLVLQVADLLHGLFLAGAFAGATAEQSYFVRADTDLNPPESIALGRIVLEVGIAPSSPLEFVVLRITRDDDAVNVQEVPRG